MSCVTRLFRSALVLWLGIINLTLATAAPAPAGTSPLDQWKVAASTFEKAGELIGQGNYQQAKSDLVSAGATFPANYSRMALDFVNRLETALASSTNMNDPGRIGSLTDLCTAMRAHKAAMALQARRTDSDSTDDPLQAWRLYESGDAPAALKSYEQKLADEIVEIWQDYYREQIRLIQAAPASRTNAPLTIALVKNRYLKGLEADADLFAALTALTRVLPHARESKEAVPVYQLILKCLTGLGDEAGREAWQDKLLAEFKSDPEVCAFVYWNRGRKAYVDKDLQRAQQWFEKVCVEYPETQAYGDAQYGLGLVLQEQQKCDAAIPQFEKLFPSKVNDHALDPESNQDCANYRFRAALRISECYEGKKDFARALEYAIRAKDRYPFVSFCKDCQRNTRRETEKRVERLKQAAAGKAD